MITFATDCSGLDAPLYALQQLMRTDDLACRIRYIFASEVEPHLYELLAKSVVKPETVYKDITERDVDKMRSVDLYVCGFPCQPFSMFGLQKGFDDNRGNVFHHVCKYIKTHEPKVFVLENVTGLLSNDKGRTFQVILELLRESGVYLIDYKVISPLDVGIPQSRQRLFIVGIHKEKTGIADDFTMSWPSKSSEQRALSEFLLEESVAKKLQPSAFRPLTKHGLANIDKARQLVPDVDRKQYIFDIRLSKYFFMSAENVCPCLTKFGMAYYISSERRYLTCLEAMRLQGLDNQHLIQQLEVCNPQKKNKTQIFYSVGNSMCVYVVAAVLKPLVDILSCCESE